MSFKKTIFLRKLSKWLLKLRKKRLLILIYGTRKIVEEPAIIRT